MPEWDRLRRGQDPALLERDAEVDVDELCRRLVHQDVLHVTVAQAQDVPDHRVGRHTLKKGEKSEGFWWDKKYAAIEDTFARNDW